MTVQARGVHATNVFHYQHVLKALIQSGYNTTVVTRHEFSESTVARIKANRFIFDQVASLAERRVAPTVSQPATHRFNSVAALLHPLAARSPIGRVNSVGVRAIALREAARCEKIARGVELYHFIEGLGGKALKGDSPPLRTICERRNVHYKALEVAIDIAGDYPFDGPERNPLTDVFDEEYDASTHILVYSDVARQSFVGRGHKQEAVSRIPLPFNPRVDISSQMERGQFLYCYVGRSDAYKGIDVAVETVERLGPPFRLVVAGPMARDVRAWLASKKRVEYRGILNARELDALYASSAALLMPSIESFGLAVLEAAAQRTHVICRETTGAKEYLRASQFTEVEGRSADIWADAIEGFSQKRVHTGVGERPIIISEGEVVDALCDLYDAISTGS